MPNEIQFILYNLPEEKGKVQVSLGTKYFGVLKRQWLNFLCG